MPANDTERRGGRGGCNPGWRNCEIAEQFGQPCIMPRHDTRTQAEKIDDAHVEALDIELQEINHEDDFPEPDFDKLWEQHVNDKHVAAEDRIGVPEDQR